MICDKCGKSNVKDLIKCAYCGAEMPKKAESSGFSDIFTFEGPDVSAANSNLNYSGTDGSERISDKDMQKLLKKQDNIINSTQKNALISLAAVGISFIVLVISIVFGVVISSGLTQSNDDLGVTRTDLTNVTNQLDEAKKLLEEYKDGETILVPTKEITQKDIDELNTQITNLESEINNLQGEKKALEEKNSNIIDQFAKLHKTYIDLDELLPDETKASEQKKYDNIVKDYEKAIEEYNKNVDEPDKIKVKENT